MRTFFILAACVLFYSGVGHAEGSYDKVTSKKKLVLTSNETDGVLIQYAKLVYQDLGKRTGFDITIQKFPSKRALAEANNGHYDGVIYRVIGLEKTYPNLRRIEVPIYTVQHTIFAKRPDIIERVHDLKSLNEQVAKKGYTVGFLLGSKKAEDELSALPEKNKIGLDSPEQAFRMLELNRIDAYLAGPGIVNRAIYKKQFHQSKIQEVGVVAEFPLFPYVHEKHASLIPIFNKALQSMVDDGTLYKIRKSLE